MPPYGLYSLGNTPEELLSEGYRDINAFSPGLNPDFRQSLYQYDPAFGGLNATQRFLPAPYTGDRPFQSMFSLNPTYYNGTNIGQITDGIPSYGGISGYRDTGGIMDIVDEATLIPKSTSPEGIEPLAMMLDPGPEMKNVGIGGQIFAPGDPRIKEASNFMAKKNLLQRFTPQALRTGLGVLATSMGFPKIAAAASAPFRGIGNLLTNLQSSTFGRSRNFAEYLRNKRAQKVAEQVAKRGEIKQIQERLDREGGGGFKGEGGYGSSAERGAALHG